jgi:hypothetical protein
MVMLVAGLTIKNIEKRKRYTPSENTVNHS